MNDKYIDKNIDKYIETNIDKYNAMCIGLMAI